MKRKVVKQGEGAYTITLPINWIRKNNVTKDTELDIHENERFLTISSSNKIKGETIELNLPKVSRRILALHLMSLYARGTEKIILNSSESIEPELKHILSNTLGFAITEKEKNKYIIQDISNIGEVNLDEIFKRVFQLIQNFCQDAINDIFGEEKETLESLKSRDEEVNKFCLYLERAINKMIYPNEIDGRTMFTYSFALEQISDEIERLWRANIEFKIKKDKDLKKIMEQVQEVLGLAFDLYYGFSSEKISKIYDLRDKVRKDIVNLQMKDKNSIKLAKSAIKIIEQSADLTHLTLMKRL